MNSINDFITWFYLTDLLNYSDEITVGQFLGQITVAFIACIFTVIMCRVILEFVKILTDWQRFK